MQDTRAAAAPRVGVLVVAYNAAVTLARTLDRLPDSFTSSVSAVLICDDASADATYEVGLAYRSSSPLPITVVRHPENLGYGGNQKAGYDWAISHGLDIVVLLHGDGQYAPEHIERLVEPLARGEADAVFGSRMMERGRALEGGMPLYKYVGNRILTGFQNRVTGMDLTEWHSGYRAYRVAALAQLDLDAFSNGFDFDTEIILGLHATGARITEVPIPTYYGDEICYVNGLEYAKDVTVDVLRYKVARMGFGSAAATAAAEDAYELKPSPHSSHGRLLTWLAALPTSSVLDVGCSDGGLGSLARREGHHVSGVDVVRHDGVERRLDRFFEADLSAGLPAEAETYDVVVAADILEHVTDPGHLLDDIKDHLKDGGQLLVSVPNFGHWYPRGRTALGLFDYDQRGPLDIGHVRFFTRRSFEKMLRKHGWQVRERVAVGSPIDVLDRGGATPLVRAVRGASWLDRLAVRLWPTMFGYQFLYRLEKA